MQGSAKLQKMNPQIAAYNGRFGGWCDDGQMRAHFRKGKENRSKPKRKDHRRNVVDKRQFG